MSTSRRSFIRATAATAAFMPGSVLGANDRINCALIGAGVRGTAIGQMMAKHASTKAVAVCDVDRSRREAFVKSIGQEAALENDWRRIIERKDIDAVMIATPDHWHSPITIAALEAGKHVYVEKPLSNTVAGAVKMLEACEKHKNLVVQVGTMQRSAVHFQEAAKIVREGGIGTVTQVVVNHGTGGMPDRKPDTTPQPVPEGFDWDLWQGPAPKHPYTPARARNWRSWYDYGGGSLTDWGIHHVDPVHMALDPDGTNPPIYVSSVAIYAGLKDPDPGVVPATWSVSVQYANFIMSILSCTPPPAGHLIMAPGFWGSRGHLMVNRAGYSVTPSSAYSGYASTLGNRNVVGAAPAARGPAAGGPPPITGAPGAAARGGAPGGMGMPGRGPAQPPIEAKEVLIENFSRFQLEWETAHVWNWLDAIKDSKKPINDLVTGFNSHLACLMAVESIKLGRALRWDPKTRTARPA